MEPALTARRSDRRVAGRSLRRTKYVNPFGSVAVRTAWSNGIASCRLRVCAAARAASSSTPNDEQTTARSRVGRPCIRPPESNDGNTYNFWMDNDFEAVIVGACRTPIGSFGGVFKDLSAVDLATITIREAIARARVQLSDIGDVVLGCVLQAGAGMN